MSDIDPRAGPGRRHWLLRSLAAALAGRSGAGVAAPASAVDSRPHADADRVAPDHALRFPRDHGAHPGAAIEWWYATGWLQPAGDGGAGAGGSGSATPPRPSHGFQVTFFRSRTPVADVPAALSAGRFAPRQLLFAHAAVTDLAGGRHRHAQRISRWSGDETLVEAHARRADTALVLGPWSLRRAAQGPTSVYRSAIHAPEVGLALELTLTSTQPLLLQGRAGWSQKGPSPQQASHYYSQPQLAVSATLTQDGQRQTLVGRGWLDHEWSQALLATDAVGWDWIGINLLDGGALTAFVLRRADASVLWAGGSHRPAASPAPVQAFSPEQVQFTPLRRWTSPDTGASYPVQWRVATPAGHFELRALLDAQELDSRASTGAVYWEGLAELLDNSGRRVGLGYLEMTGRAGALKLSG